MEDLPRDEKGLLKADVWDVIAKEVAAKPGEASVCLWEDDKLAAMSLGVDNNCTSDLPYWKELS